MTKRLTDILPRNSRKGMIEVFETLQMPLLPVLGNMEQAGVVLDTAFLAEMSVRWMVSQANRATF